MSRPPSRVLWTGAALLAALMLAVLYGIVRGPVHAPGDAPPRALARLVVHGAPVAAPDAEFAGANGGRVRLSDFRGAPLLVNLWATWCPPCVEELPALVRFAEAVRADGLRVVAISLGREDAAETAAFLEEHGALALGVHIDDTRRMLQDYEAYALPLSILFDAEGREIARMYGPGDWDAPEAAAYMRALIAARAGTPQASS